MPRSKSSPRGISIVILTVLKPAPFDVIIVAIEIAAPHAQQPKSLNSRPETTATVLRSPYARFLYAEVVLMDIAGLDPSDVMCVSSGYA